MADFIIFRNPMSTRRVCAYSKQKAAHNNRNVQHKNSQINHPRRKRILALSRAILPLSHPSEGRCRRTERGPSAVRVEDKVERNDDKARAAGKWQWRMWRRPRRDVKKNNCHRRNRKGTGRLARPRRDEKNSNCHHRDVKTVIANTVLAMTVEFRAGKVEFHAGRVEFRTGKMEFRAGRVEFRPGRVEFRARKVGFNNGRVELRAKNLTCLETVIPADNAIMVT